MHTASFDELLKEMKQDPDFTAAYEEENGRLNTAVSLIRAREQTGLSQAQLARKSHVSRSTINRIEQGRLNPSIRTLESLARAMGKNLVISFG